MKKFDRRAKCEVKECKHLAIFNKFLNKEHYCEEHQNEAIYNELFPKCVSCEQRLKVDDGLYDHLKEKPEFNNNEVDKYGNKVVLSRYNEYTFTRDGKIMCGGCESDQFMECEATVRFFNNGNDNVHDNDSVLQIGRYLSRYYDDNEVIEDNDDSYRDVFCFTTEYKHTDGWRGYNDVYSNKYTEIHDDTALSMSNDEQNLKKFDDAVRELLVNEGIRLARVMTSTSNVCASGYALFVHNNDMKKYKKLLPQIEKLKIELRDEGEYISTALGHRN